MANPWFRMYSEFATDAKVQSMPEVMQRRLIMLFCLRCSDVTVTLCDEELAFALRISDEELSQTKALFLRKGFIDDSWEVVNWDKRQYSSDSSTARTAAYRERKKQQKKNSVTSPERHSDSLDTDTDTDTDTEKNIATQAADKISDSMIAIFDHWKKIMNHPKAKLDDKRKKLIRAALKLGYSETELITAVNGCAKSPYHMGQDGRNTTVYDDIELILRDAKHIDQFLKINSMPPAPMANQPKFDPLAYVNRGAVQAPDTSVVDFQSGHNVKQLGAA